MAQGMLPQWAHVGIVYHQAHRLFTSGKGLGDFMAQCNVYQGIGGVCRGFNVNQFQAVCMPTVPDGLLNFLA